MTTMRTTAGRKHNGVWLPAGMRVEIIQLTGTVSTGSAVRDGRVSDGLWVRTSYPSHVVHGQVKFPAELAQCEPGAARVTAWLGRELATLGIDITELEDVPQRRKAA